MRFITSPADRLMLALLCLATGLPFFNFARFMPAPDWWTNTLVVIPVMLALLVGFWQKTDVNELDTVTLPRFVPWVLLWWCLAFLPAVMRRDGGQYALALPESLAVILVVVAASTLFKLQQRLGRSVVVHALAFALLLTAILQALIGVAQLEGLAPLANGWLMFDPVAPTTNIVGNIAQRNQFAHVLCWGVVAAAYLYAQRHLRMLMMLAVMFLLAMVAGWSSGRLPLAYAAAMLVLAGVWWFGGGDRRMALAVLLGGVMILLMQWGSSSLAHLFSGTYLPSGMDRLDSAGFGLRRRIEWQKAWMVMSAHPWVGVGVGGYAYYSAWLEAFGSLAKLPEGALFTHAHNLVMQLLAETGIPATLVAASGVSACLLPYLQRKNRHADSLFLVLLASITLIHSMFEYPLWYLPFLSVFMFVLVLSPQEPVMLAVRASLRRTGAGLVIAVCAVYVGLGIPGFFTIVQSQQPSRNVAENQRRVASLLQVARNPFWSYEAELTLSNYLIPTPHDVKVKRAHYEELTRYRPYPMLLCHLAMLRAWDRQPQAAEEAITMAIAAYPDTLPQMLMTLVARHEPEISPLTRLVIKAQMAAQKGGPLAAVNAVASRGQLKPLP